MLKKHKNIMICLAPILLLMLVLPMFAQADDDEPGWAAQKFVDAITWVLEAIFNACGIIAGWMGKLFEISVVYSVERTDFYNAPDGIVATGWEICRDFANMFFIFILIFIGIATILQLPAYNYKRLLLGVIIAALLVNFSMMISFLIIDASNVVAMEFICAMTDGDCTAGGVGGESIGSAMANSLGLSSIMAVTEGLEPDKVAIAYIMGSVLLLITAFILLAGAFLFFIRLLTLMFLVIFAPFAFIGTAMKWGFAKQWWHKLLNQSFLAPAYLFLLYIVLVYVGDSGSGIIGMVNADSASFAGLFLNPGVDNITILVQYIIMGGLLIGCLVIAQKLGAEGATRAMGGAQWVRRRAQGYAGRIGKAGGIGALRGARRAAGGAAEKIATGEGRVATTLRKIPLAARGAAAIARANRQKLEDTKKKHEKYSDKELKNMTPLVGGFNRAAITQILAERKNLKPEGKLTSENIKTNKKLMEKYGMSTKEIDRQKYQYAESDTERAEAIQTMPTEALTELAQAYNKDPQNSPYKEYFENEDVQKAMLEKINPTQIKNIYNEGGQAADKFFESLSNLAETTDKTSEDIAKALDSLGNQSSAGWVRGTAAQPILKTYGVLSELTEEPRTSIIPGTETEYKKATGQA